MRTSQEGAVFDVAVVGAGPAGSATARTLAQRGARVVLIERTRFDTPRIGESLAPNVQEPLRRLGLWDAFLALAPLPSWGTRSLWGDTEQQAHSHILNPFGCGWHVDRRAFDLMLANSAASAGVSVRLGTAFQHCEWRDGTWTLHTASSMLRARVLVDATGRRAQMARTLGAQRMLLDQLIGLAVDWSGVNAQEQGHLLVESSPAGWWYSAPLPAQQAGAMVAILMTDADLCVARRLTAAERWNACLAAAPATHLRLRSARPADVPRVHCAESHRLLRGGKAPSNGPWLAVGDAALAVDPVSGSGVPRALRTALAAADTVQQVLSQTHSWCDSLAAYDAQRDAECTTYLLERANYYAAEQRFNTEFWLRRQMRRLNLATPLSER